MKPRPIPPAQTPLRPLKDIMFISSWHRYGDCVYKIRPLTFAEDEWRWILYEGTNKMDTGDTVAFGTSESIEAAHLAAQWAYANQDSINHAERRHTM